MADEVERRCGARPQRVLADGGFFSNENLREMEGRGIETYRPGARVEHRSGGRWSGTNGGERSQFAAGATEATHDRGPCLVQGTPSAGRAGDRDFERAARDATVPAPGAVGGSGRVDARGDGLQPLPLSRSAPQRLIVPIASPDRANNKRNRSGLCAMKFRKIESRHRLGSPGTSASTNVKHRRCDTVFAGAAPRNLFRTYGASPRCHPTNCLLRKLSLISRCTRRLKSVLLRRTAGFTPLLQQIGVAFAQPVEQ
jgi:hypothetical protein